MLRELFRHKLENAELTPSPSVGTNLMRRLGRREFLHFNAARFNIWYAGGIAVAGAALAIILSSGPGEKTGQVKVNQEKEIYQPGPADDLKSGIVRDSGVNNINTTETATEKSNGNQKERTGTIRGKQQVNDDTSPFNNIDLPSGVVSQLPEKKTLDIVINEKDKLREKLYQGENLIRISASEGCAPLKVKFRNMATTYDSCMWTFGDGGHSKVKDPEWIFDVAGEYTIVLSVYDSEGLVASSAIKVTVSTRPVARFEFIPENAVLPDDEIRFINYSTDAVRFRWDFGDGSSSELADPNHSYSKFGNYNIKLVAISESGCADSIKVMNAFSSAGYFIDFPNAFIPNPNGPSGGYYTPKSDEASQVFHAVSTGVSDYQMRIFSKRGILIFESNDINIGWDGYFKGQLCEPGVYIWKVRGNFTNGEPFTKMGDVTLLKN